MWELAWANVGEHKMRFVAAAVAIVAGVAFLTAGSMLTTSISRSLGGEVDDQYRAVSAAVQPPEAQGQGLARVQIPESILDDVRRVPGVRAAVGEVLSVVSILEDGKRSVPGTFDSGQSFLRTWITEADLNPLQITEGRPPRAEGEVTVDRGTAADRHLRVGSMISLSSSTGAVEATVVGITRFGTSDAPDAGGTITASLPWAFSLGGDGSASFARILVLGDDDVSPAELVRRVGEVVPKSLEVVTGDTFREDQKGQTAAISEVLGPVLQGFAYLSLFVAGFVIFNTFAVVVAQRTRELALIRAVAATPKQVRRSLKVEGLVVGGVGAAAGVALGALLTFALIALLRALDFDLPSAGVVVTPGIVIQGLLSGVIVTVVSVAIPARRAAKTPPVEAMRASATERAGVPRARLVAAATMVVLGLLGLVIGSPWYLLALGALLFLVGVFVAGPGIVVGIAAALRPVTARLGVPGHLARENLRRAPRRTATTANALVIGLFLVTLVSVGGASLRDWTVGEVDQLSSADFVVTTISGAMPDGLLDRIDAIKGVERAARMRSVPVLEGGNPTTLTAADPAALGEIGLRPESGKWSDAGGVVTAFVNQQPARVGQEVHVTLPDGTAAALPVSGVLPFSFDALMIGNLVTPAALDRLVPGIPETGVLLSVDRASYDRIKSQLDELTAGYSSVFVIEGNILGRAIAGLFDFLINAVNALLGMSVVVALVGIVNTLSLSIHERRRELGLLRAVGMTPGEVRGMVLLEALFIAVVGTVVGMLAGGVMAWLLLRAADVSGGVSLEWGRFGVVALIGLGSGLVASVFPLRRVTRLDVVASIEGT